MMSEKLNSVVSSLLISAVLCGTFLFAADFVIAQGLPVVNPEAAGMNSAKLDQIDQIVLADIAEKKMPGAVVVVGHKGKIVYRKAFGNRSLVPTVEPMTVDTIFDVASLTKPVATATSIMILVEQGKLRLNDTIGKFIPDIEDEDVKRITILQLLTHTSGLRPSFDMSQKWEGREGMLAALKKEKLRNPPGTRFVYSDVGFIVLGEIIERISGDDVGYFQYLSVARALGSNDTIFVDEIIKQNGAVGNVTSTPFQYALRVLALSNGCGRCAPTENIRGQNSYLGPTFTGDERTGNEILRGKVHDPTAFRMGGIAGHAGLFSTADDLARYAQMMINGGTLEGKRILSAASVSKMTAPYVVSPEGHTRGLGWDMNTSFSSNRGEFFPLGSFGHTGFTGPMIWIDPTSETFVVFMANRVHPDGKGDVVATRARIATIAASAIEDMPIDKLREAEAKYNAAVAAQIPGFRERVEAAQRPAAVAGGTPAFPATTVLNGIDILERNGFKELEGKKIGLVTNHTGKNLKGKSTIDILHEAKNVTLVSMFAPEHGIRGELDTEKIDDTKDEKTGLPVYSLYKDGMRRPKPEQLKGLDAIVYDIQDIGARFYTYTATLKNVMEEAAKLDIPIYVLDRPNPINGVDVEGPLADEDKLAFIAAHTIPVRYGLTIGELGQMMNTERKIGAKLHIIKMENWSRSMWFDETGQTWINPSPNMRSLTQAILYPGIGLLETTNLSVGRGTDTPFEVIGAPWLNGRKFAEYMNGRNLPGVRFIPIKYRPNASVFKDEDLGGVNIVITDRNRFKSVKTGIEIAAALRKLYPKDWIAERYHRLLVNGEILKAVTDGESPEAIEKRYLNTPAEFTRRSASYLLYK